MFDPWTLDGAAKIAVEDEAHGEAEIARRRTMSRWARAVPNRPARLAIYKYVCARATLEICIFNKLSEHRDVIQKQLCSFYKRQFYLIRFALSTILFGSAFSHSFDCFWSLKSEICFGLLLFLHFWSLSSW